MKGRAMPKPNCTAQKELDVERTALSGASPNALEAHMTVERNQISHPWWMSKDGRSWWSLDRRIDLAKRIAAERGSTHQERAALEARLLRKWMGK